MDVISKLQPMIAHFVVRFYPWYFLVVSIRILLLRSSRRSYRWYTLNHGSLITPLWYLTRVNSTWYDKIWQLTAFAVDSDSNHCFGWWTIVITDAVCNLFRHQLFFVKNDSHAVCGCNGIVVQASQCTLTILHIVHIATACFQHGSRKKIVSPCDKRTKAFCK